MRCAVVQDGLVVNVIEAEPGFLVPGTLVIPSEVGAPGWTYDGSTFHRPVSPQIEAPADVHVAWLRAALAEAGKLDQVDAAVTSKGAVKKALWDYATSISRSDPDVIAVATALSIDLAALFLRADAIRRERGM